MGFIEKEMIEEIVNSMIDKIEKKINVEEQEKEVKEDLNNGIEEKDQDVNIDNEKSDEKENDSKVIIPC